MDTPLASHVAEGELKELYSRACGCARKEIELVVACFVYRARHTHRSRVRVSKDILGTLEAAGCAARKKVCACSLGMLVCFRAGGTDDYFGDWARGLSVADHHAVLSYDGLVSEVVSRLRARHEEALTALRASDPAAALRACRSLSLRKLYGVFAKWTARSKIVASANGNEEEAPFESLAAAAVENGEKEAEEEEEEEETTENEEEEHEEETGPTSERGRGKRSAAVGSSRGSATEEEEEDEEEEGRQRRAKRIRTSETNTAGSRPRQQRRVSPARPQSNDHHQAGGTILPTIASATARIARSDLSLASKNSWKQAKQQRQQPHRPAPPPAVRHPPTATTGPQPEGGRAETEPQAVAGGNQASGEGQEDDEDFEKVYGVNWPLRHIGAFMAAKEVEASVSHRATGKEGRHLVLRKCGNISEFPARQALVDRLNKAWKKDLGNHAFNAVQSNLYSGVGPHSDDAVSSLDHIGFHKNGRCKVRGPPIVSGCYSNNVTTDDEETTAAFLIHHQSDPNIRMWIPQTSGTGYAFGGKHCHKKYYHGKFLFGDWRAYHHHISITFSCYHPWQSKGGGTADESPPPGVNVTVDWNLTSEARLWSRRYLLGQVPKSGCHPEVRKVNEDSIVTSNYESVWGPWDEFKNTSILQLLQLHPADGGQGIAGNGDHTLSILLMNNPKYSNRFPSVFSLFQQLSRFNARVTVDRAAATLKVEYYAGSDRGEGLLERAREDRILVRVFLSPGVPSRPALFVGNITTVLFLPLMVVESRSKDTEGVFFVLRAHLSEQELGHRLRSSM